MCELAAVDVIKHHRGRAQQRNWIGSPLTSQDPARAMHRLKNRGVLAHVAAGAIPKPPTRPAISSDRISPKRLVFHLSANVRTARNLIPGGRYEDIDVVLMRENLEGPYVGFEHFIPIDDDPHAIAIGSGVNSRASCRRIAEYAFEYAVHNGREKVTIVHNILKARGFASFSGLDNHCVEGPSRYAHRDPSPKLI